MNWLILLETVEASGPSAGECAAFLLAVAFVGVLCLAMSAKDMKR